MSRRWFAAVGTILCLGFGMLRAAGPQRDDIEAEDLKLAEEAVLLHMAVVSSPVGRNQDCAGGEGLLGLAVIGARSSPTSLAALSGLVRFRFDGLLGEEYDSHVIAKGPKIEKYIRLLNPERLHVQCAHEFAALQKEKAYAAIIQGSNETNVCSSVIEIRERIQTLLRSLSGEKGHER
jgi:hypothetical protein